MIPNDARIKPQRHPPEACEAELDQTTIDNSPIARSQKLGTALSAIAGAVCVYPGLNSTLAIFTVCWAVLSAPSRDGG